MKKILITGAGSYIGTSFENYLKNFGDEYSVDTVDMIDGSWKEKPFSGYDAVFHVAGIAHDTGNKKDADLYYRVNRDLAIETAEKAKTDGVKQFVFMSSMLVYNGCKDRNITSETQPRVKGCYGDSKLQADLALQRMNSDEFCVSVLRPPMIYGKNCKGNFPRLIGLAEKLPFFPDVKNRRSMLYVGNLCEFIRVIVDREIGGVLFPQNSEYVCTTELVRAAMTALGKKKRFTRIFNPLIALAKPIVGSVNKMFGNLTYDKSMSVYDFNYNVADFQKSIEESVGRL